MRVSVVLCTHAMARYDAFTEAAESVLGQTYDDRELVIVVDGAEDVYERADGDFGGREDVLVHLNEENVGLLASRNRGAECADGEVVAFIDDDAVADEAWLAHLVGAYESEDVLAAGGKMTPAWVDGKPEFLPEEFYWLVGVTHRGFTEEAGEVRNTFGSNISFRREVFLELDGFDIDIGGRKGDKHLQGGETELCARLQAEYGKGVYYVPEAEVAHKVFDYRTDPLWLVKRAFWQGYSKRGMETFVPESTGEESEFLEQLLGEFVPGRVEGLVREPSLREAKELVALIVLTGAVGTGYAYGFLMWR